MANSKAPKHDFAPAWLKIPEQDNLKSGGGKSGEHADNSGRSHRRDDYYHRYGHPPGGPSPDYYDRRFGGGKFPTHPMENEYYAAHPPGSTGYNGAYTGLYGGYYPTEKCNPSHFRSQYRDKFANARYPPQVNGGYQQYYDRYPPYDFYPTDAGPPYYNNGYGGGGGGRGSSKRSYGGERESRHNKRDKERGMEMENSKEGALEEEFPSLNGECESCENKAGKPINNSVWDGKPKIGTGKNQNNQTTSKSLLTNKSGGTPKKILKSSSIDINSNSNNAKTAFSTDTKKETSKEGSPTPPIFVTQPKNLTNKKSEFLKALRRDNPEAEVDLAPKTGKEADKEGVHRNGTSIAMTNLDEEKKEILVNGVHDLSLGTSPNENILSSSLEAEQRLLREMGWTECDDEPYELTEEERHEMEKLSQEIKLRKEQRNGSKKTLPKTWSPQHHMFSHPIIPPPSDDVSSSDSDSDLEL